MGKVVIVVVAVMAVIVLWWPAWREVVVGGSQIMVGDEVAMH